MSKHFFNLLHTKYRLLSTKPGFTIIELLVIITVIGVMSTMMVYAYNGVQAKVFDSSVEADIERMGTLQSNYKYSNGAAGKEYYSGFGSDEELDFTPKTGNVIDVVVSATDFCIRGYNTKGTKDSIENAYIKESTPGACSSINASAMAISDSIGTPFWTSVTSGASHTCGVTTKGKAYCWGSNGFGQLGNGTNNPSQVAVAVDDSNYLNGLTIKYIEADNQYTCVIASNDQVYCWGYNSYGNLGDQSNDHRSSPVPVYNAGVLAGKTVRSLSVGGDHACVIANSKPYCWGDNTYGQLGTGDSQSSNVPVSSGALGALNGKQIKHIMAGASHSCAVTTEDVAYCWGQNIYGQLGAYVTYQKRELPVYVYMEDVLYGKTIKSMVGHFHTCAIASDDKAYCWGINMSGQVGDDTTTHRFKPVQVLGGLSNKTVKSISVDEGNTCAITTNNQTYCWGSNGYGQVGDGFTTQRNAPVAVLSTVGELSGKTIKSITSGWHNTCSLASDNNIYCWGRNQVGQFGNDTLINSLTATVSLSPPN